MEIDKKDQDIINVLIDDSRLSYRKIAKKVDLSVATVLNRIKRLEKENIIKGYSAIVDYEKLGYDVWVIIQIRISKGKLFDVEQKIATHPNVFIVYDHTGDFDTTIVAKFKTRKLMDNFLKKIQTYDFVERTETKLILNTLKEDQIKL